MKKILSLALAGVLALSVAACSSDKAVDINVADVWTEYETVVPQEERAMSEALDATMLEQMYGITSDEIVEFVAYMPMMMTHADETFIAKVAEGKMEDVKAKIDARQKALEQQWSTYLPDQYELVQNHKLVENGDYILFTIGHNSDKIVEIFNAQFQ